MSLDSLRHQAEVVLGWPPLYHVGEPLYVPPPPKIPVVTEFIKSMPKKTRGKGKPPTLRERVAQLEERVAELEEQYRKLPPQP